VLVLDGQENSLSIVRHLGRIGISVSVSGTLDTWGLFSRYCKDRFRIPAHQNPSDYWAELLLGENSRVADGTILFPCSDDALRFIANNNDALARKYVFDEATPTQRLQLLDKLKTLEIAREAGIETPRFWRLETGQNLEPLRSRVDFPVMIKPLDTFGFAKQFKTKLFIVKSNFREVEEKVQQAWDAGHQVMVVEMIPGPDSLLSSYYTYRTADNRFLFDFTKRIFRRYPINQGPATYHATKWLPETAEAGRTFFAGINFLGLGNIEFKRDTRDGKLKIIEANARFTAAQELALRAGMPIDLIKYCHLTGQPIPVFPDFTEDLHYWYPLRDAFACRELFRRGELDLRTWLATLKPIASVSPIHSFRDPRPSFAATYGLIKRHLPALLK